MRTSAKTCTPKDYIDHDKNVISPIDTDILVEVVHGRIELNAVALQELKIEDLTKIDNGSDLRHNLV